MERSSKRVPKTGKLSKENVSNSEEAAQLPTSFKVVAGSYEKLLYGLEGSVEFTEQQGEEESRLRFKLKPVFIFPAHVSCIKAVAASPHGGKWLATGSTDEIIKIWDLKRRKEVGGLMHHQGEIFFRVVFGLSSCPFRVDNASFFSFSIPFDIWFGGRHAVFIPRKRLVRPSRPSRPQGSSQLGGRSSVWKSGS
jgi:WD40 repeat protein